MFYFIKPQTLFLACFLFGTSFEAAYAQSAVGGHTGSNNDLKMSREDGRQIMEIIAVYVCLDEEQTRQDVIGACRYLYAYLMSKSGLRPEDLNEAFDKAEKVRQDRTSWEPKVPQSPELQSELSHILAGLGALDGVRSEGEEFVIQKVTAKFNLGGLLKSFSELNKQN